jgi:hypothetical protein
VFRHIVLFRVRDDTPDGQVEEALSALRALGDSIDAPSWTVELSMDARKGRIIVEDATFTDDASFERFRAHPTHVATTETMARISDWWVGDYHVRDN